MHVDMFTASNSENTTLSCRVNGEPIFKAIFSPIIEKQMTRGHAAIMTLKTGDAITVTLETGSLRGLSSLYYFSAFYGFLIAPI